VLGEMVNSFGAGEVVKLLDEAYGALEDSTAAALQAGGVPSLVPGAVGHESSNTLGDDVGDAGRSGRKRRRASEKVWDVVGSIMITSASLPHRQDNTCGDLASQLTSRLSSHLTPIGPPMTWHTSLCNIVQRWNKSSLGMGVKLLTVIFVSPLRWTTPRWTKCSDHRRVPRAWNRRLVSLGFGYRDTGIFKSCY